MMGLSCVWDHRHVSCYSSLPLSLLHSLSSSLISLFSSSFLSPSLHLPFCLSSQPQLFPPHPTAVCCCVLLCAAAVLCCCVMLLCCATVSSCCSSVSGTFSSVSMLLCTSVFPLPYSSFCCNRISSHSFLMSLSIPHSLSLIPHPSPHPPGPQLFNCKINRSCVFCYSCFVSDESTSPSVPLRGF